MCCAGFCQVWYDLGTCGFQYFYVLQVILGQSAANYFCVIYTCSFFKAPYYPLHTSGALVPYKISLVPRSHGSGQVWPDWHPMRRPFAPVKWGLNAMRRPLLPYAMVLISSETGADFSRGSRTDPSRHRLHHLRRWPQVGSSWQDVQQSLIGSKFQPVLLFYETFPDGQPLPAPGPPGGNHRFSPRATAVARKTKPVFCFCLHKRNLYTHLNGGEARGRARLVTVSVVEVRVRPSCE